MRKKCMMAVVSAAALCLLCAQPTAALGGSAPYQAYTYSYAYGDPVAVECPSPYLPERVINLRFDGVEVKEPQNFCHDEEGNWYIANTGANSILCLNERFELVRNITGFDMDGAHETFSGPEGLCVSPDGYLYVADTQNERIVKLTKEGEFVALIPKPTTGLFGQGTKYLPSKIQVGESGMIYATANNDFSGILQFDTDGRFEGYMGSNTARFNLIDFIWKKISTKEAAAYMQTFVPVEYTNIHMDSDGFIFTVSAAEDEATPIKRLNASGKDTLVRSESADDIAGDAVTRSVLTDITDNNGTYSVLDTSLGRIFTYSPDGYLLYAFGNLGSQRGSFHTPTAIDALGDNLYVLDRVNANITVFEPTAFALDIQEGLSAYSTGDYDKSEAAFERVLQANVNYELAFVQLGKIYLQRGDYEKSMEYFLQGNYKGQSSVQDSGYNKAFSEYRSAVLMQNLAWIVLGAVVLIVVVIFFKKLCKRRGR